MNHTQVHVRCSSSKNVQKERRWKNHVYIILSKSVVSRSSRIMMVTKINHSWEEKLFKPRWQDQH